MQMRRVFTGINKLFGLIVAALLLMLSPGTLFAPPLFPQCPAVGVNTGCQFLIVVTAVNGSGAATAFTVASDPTPPNNASYDGVEDTLVGVQNNSGATLRSVTINSNTDVFAFDGDGVCNPGVGVTPAGCVAGKLNPADISGYGGPNVTFSNISVNFFSGTVNFSPGVAAGGSAFFALEDQLTASQIGTPGPAPGPGPGVPVPPSILLALTGLAAVGLYQIRRKLAAYV